MTKLPLFEQVKKINGEQARKSGVGPKASKGYAVPDSNLAHSRRPPIRPRRMHGLGPTIVLVIQILPQPHLIRLKFDRDFQRFRDKPRVMALLVRNQTLKDFRIRAQAGNGPIAR